MIDTISLLIPKSETTIMQFQRNGEPDWDLQSKTDQYAKYVKNPSKQDMASGLYFPRLTTYSRFFGQDANMRIELSLPKLLYKNNLHELTDADFDQVVTTLRARLYRMGVAVSEKSVARAPVSAVHYSKNIILEDGYTASYVISELSKIDLRKSFDFTRARFINNGQSLYAHTNSHQFALYDKIADLAKGKKKAIDKDQTPFQQELFRGIRNYKQQFEVLRFEIRLVKKHKLRKVLSDLGHDVELNFRNVFSEAISKDVVTSYWNGLIKARNMGIFSLQLSQKEILRMIYSSYPTIMPNRAIYLTGLFLLGKDGEGMRELRSIFENRASSRTWYRISKDMRDLSSNIQPINIRSWIPLIDLLLAEYTPLTNKHYEKFTKEKNGTEEVRAFHP